MENEYSGLGRMYICPISRSESPTPFGSPVIGGQKSFQQASHEKENSRRDQKNSVGCSESPTPFGSPVIGGQKSFQQKGTAYDNNAISSAGQASRGPYNVSAVPMELTKTSGWPSFKASFTLDCPVTVKDQITAYHLRRMDCIAHRRRWYRFLYKDQRYKGPHYCTLYFYLWAMGLLGDDAAFVYKFRKSFNGLFFINHRGKMRKVRTFRKKLSHGRKK